MSSSISSSISPSLLWRVYFSSHHHRLHQSLLPFHQNLLPLKLFDPKKPSSTPFCRRLAKWILSRICFSLMRILPAPQLSVQLSVTAMTISTSGALMQFTCHVQPHLSVMIGHIRRGFGLFVVCELAVLFCCAQNAESSFIFMNRLEKQKKALLPCTHPPGVIPVSDTPSARTCRYVQEETKARGVINTSSRVCPK